MKNYMIHYVKHNIRKCAIMVFMLSACSTLTLFTLEIMHNLITEINYSWRDDVSKEDLKTMIFLLQCGVGIIIGFCYLLVNNTYSVILRGREREFNLLNNIGFYRNRIKLLLMGEGIVLGTFSVGVGILCSRGLSLIFMNNFGLYEVQNLSVGIYGIVLVGIILALLYIILKNLKVISIGLNDIKNLHDTFIGKAKVVKITMFCIIGTVLAIGVLCLEQFFTSADESNNAIIIQTAIFAVAIIIALDGWLYWLLILLKKISLRIHNIPLYLASEQCIYNFRKVKSIINSIIMAVMLLVGFLGMFESIKGTTRKYVNESVNYDYMVICDTLPQMTLKNISNELDIKTNHEKYYALALTIKTLDKNEKIQIFTGIDENYYKVQRFYIDKDSDINQIYKENELNVLYSSKMANEKELKVGDMVKEYDYEGKMLQFRIGALYDPINLKQSFTSRQTLSKVLYGVNDKYNTLFLKGFSSNEVDEILDGYGFENYTKYDMSTVRKQAIDQSLNGTEMIEVLLYCSMFFVASLVVNMFILSFTDRIRQYTELTLLGTNKSKLTSSIIIESIIIFMGGSIIGYLLGVPFIKGALAFIENELIFETIVFIPYVKLLSIILVSFFGMLLCIYTIGRNCLNGNLLKFNYRE